MITEITSSSNPTYKMLKALKSKKERMEKRLFTVEGIKSVNDAVFCGAPIQKVVFRTDFFAQHSHMEADLAQKGIDMIQVADRLFDALCDTQAPQGVLGIIRMDAPKFGAEHICRGGFYVYCDRIQDPGNAGTIIRTADAAGALGVVFSTGSTDIYSPKTVRSTMGSLFHLPIFTDTDTSALIQLKQAGFQVAAGALMENALTPRQADFSKDTVLIIGNESNGISDEIKELCDLFVMIPIYGRAESLNASVAAGILMYEAAQCKNTNQK